MSLHTALVAIKTANAPLQSLIGTRFHPDALPQQIILPAVRYQVISRVRPDYAFYGRPDISNVRVQLDGYASSSRNRNTLRTRLIDCFLPAARVNGSHGGETIFDIRIDNEREMLEMLDTNTEAYRISIDLIVDIQEA